MNGKCSVSIEIQDNQLRATIKIDGEENVLKSTSYDLKTFNIHIWLFLYLKALKKPVFWFHKNKVIDLVFSLQLTDTYKKNNTETLKRQNRYFNTLIWILRIVVYCRTHLFFSLQKEDPIKETIPDTLIAILASCAALVLILCCFTAYCTYHRRSYRKNQVNILLINNWW